MNKWWLFVIGIVVGFFFSFLVDRIGGNKISESPKTETVGTKVEKEPEPEEEEEDGLHYFEEPGDIIKESSFKVLQVLAKDAALVNGKDEYGYYHGTIYLIVNNEGKYYYDDEIVKVPTGKVLRQIGIYQYPTRRDIVKTVPIIMIMDK